MMSIFWFKMFQQKEKSVCVRLNERWLNVWLLNLGDVPLRVYYAFFLPVAPGRFPLSKVFKNCPKLKSIILYHFPNDVNTFYIGKCIVIS